MRFLIDECLTLDLISIATCAGYEAYHVAHVGKASWKDLNVVRYADEGDFVLVTNNASDFRKLYASRSLHAGLIIIVPNAAREMQKALFQGALDQLTTTGELINGVLEVDIKGDEFTYTIYDLPEN